MCGEEMYACTPKCCHMKCRTKKRVKLEFQKYQILVNKVLKILWDVEVADELLYRRVRNCTMHQIMGREFNFEWRMRKN